LTIENIDWRPITDHPEFYEKLIKQNLFNNKSYIFGVALALGYILNRKSATAPSHRDGGFVRIMVTYDDREKYPYYNDFLNFLFEHVAKGSDEPEKLKDLNKIADGGIEYLIDQDTQQHLEHLDISQIIQDINNKIRDTSDKT